MPRHSLSSSAGFTLIEVTLVLAISGLLLVGVLAGQGALQRRARFDAAVDQVIQTIAYARNYALSNINLNGPGTSTTALLAGDSLIFDNAHLSSTPPHQLAVLEPIYAAPDPSGNADPATYSHQPPGLTAIDLATTCPSSGAPYPDGACSQQFFHLPDVLTVAVPSSPSATAVSLHYVNVDGRPQLCPDAGAGYPSISAACGGASTNPVTFTLTDPSGLSATVQVDPTSGYAKRLN